ncbi:MAG: hypothetical protein H6706_21950 [Myxococcales bacterium]|nr:hypothetical protein [Myxococcales bacterium]
MRISFWAGLGLLVAGCAPVVGSGALGAGVIFAALALAGLAGRAQARPARGDACGAPMPKPVCTGTEHQSCVEGRVLTSCCPQGAKCNYRYAPFQACGDDTCVPGKDPGQCPPKEPIALPAATQADCNGSWEKACVAGKVTMACIMPVPTNYAGPNRNPPFRECGEDRCTTSPFIEHCYPVKPAEGEAACLTGWTKVCLQGRITERCLPLAAPKSQASTDFTACPTAGTCVLGQDADACTYVPRR